MFYNPKKNKLISIITSAYNSENYIEETYASIRSQSYSDWEWIVTDDCSSDSTWNILKKISSNDPRVFVYRLNKNLGAAAARNNSISKSSGLYLAFIDSDDIWLPSKLERQIYFMGDDVDFSFTSYFVINGAEKLIVRVVDDQDCNFFSYKDMLCKAATIGCSTVILRRDAFDDIFMPLIRTGQDYALWLNLLKSGKSAYLLRTPLTLYRITPGSLSRNKLKKAFRQWEIYRKLQKISFFSTLYYFTYYIIRAIVKR